MEAAKGMPYRLGLPGAAHLLASLISSCWEIAVVLNRKSILKSQQSSRFADFFYPCRLSGSRRSNALDSQWPLSGVHSIMMEKSAQPGVDGGCTPTLFHYIYHYVQSCSVLSSWEGIYTPPTVFLLYTFMYSVLGATPPPSYTTFQQNRR